MSTIFAINFRREAYRQDLARTRRRAVLVGAWVAYFGLLAVALGLYALNLTTLARRTHLLENQNAHLRARGGPPEAWRPGSAELTQAERILVNPGRWRSRLTRLAVLLPANTMLTSVTVNPDLLPDPADQEMLMITGLLKPIPGQDRMQGIMQFVSALHADPVFSSQYRSIKLVESRFGDRDALAQFRIECR